MLGYWAIGSPAIATRPTITMTIAITIATMGRLIKNRYMTVNAPRMLVGLQVSERLQEQLSMRGQEASGLQSFLALPSAPLLLRLALPASDLRRSPIESHNAPLA